MNKKEERILAPLVIFVYNRLEITKQTLKAINENILATETEVYIFSDGAKNEADVIKIKKVREYIKEFAVNSKFKNVYIIERENNMGLANSVIKGVTNIINKFKKIIVLEDDLITNQSFLCFMNDCLDFYEYKKDVWSIGGTTFRINALSKYKKDVYACYRVESWGWATWIDRWEKVDWKVSDYEEFMRDRKAKKKFKQGGQDRINSLKRQMEGKTDSWAIRWDYQAFKENMVTILPTRSLIKNIGFDGSGVHCGTVDRFYIDVDDSPFEYKLEDVEIDKKIMKNFRKYFYKPLYNRILDYMYLKIMKD
jgi:hypothetical protein